MSSLTVNPYERVSKENEEYIGKTETPKQLVFCEYRNGKRSLKIRVRNTDGDDEFYEVDTRALGEKHPISVYAHIKQKYGWRTLNALGHVVLLTWWELANRWPETGENGGSLVGLASLEQGVVPHINFGFVGLYKNGGELVPHVVMPDPLERQFENGDAVALPSSKLAQEFTVDLTEYRSMTDAIRSLQEERFWHVVGGPHDICLPGEGETKVVEYATQIGPEFVSQAHKPRHYTQNGVKHRLNTHDMEHFRQ